MGHDVVDVVTRVEQVRVGGGGVEGEDDGPGLELQHDLLGDRLERNVRDGEDDDVGVLDGVGQFGDLAAGFDGALLPGEGSRRTGRRARSWRGCWRRASPSCRRRR